MDARRVSAADSGMALARNGHTRLYWERTGSGPPVLLIMGLGLSGAAWWRTVPVLARRLQVITFDNRGIGRSESLRPNYTTEAMADDAVAVLDALGLETAHVYGISLGGMVAQQVALRHPERVRSLVLGATQAGGPRAVRADDEVVAFFRRRTFMRAEEAARASVPLNYGPRCREQHPERIAEDIERRLATPFPRHAYAAQLCAAALHNVHGRLGRIRVPTLVVHGTHDRLIPVANAAILADGIPAARVRILEEVGHVYPTEEPGVDEAVAAFLADGRG
jgi:3-oxoadipate enol-lactonase